MADFLSAMNSDGSLTVVEHVARRVLPGDIEAVRGRLVHALERLGYEVVSENPLQARRAARKNAVRADFLDYPRKLSVSLRQSSAAATVATFDFAVKHSGCAFGGDKKTLEREADAVAALAAAPPASSFCRVCGTENAGDARFCRLCGAPGAAGVPAEVEVMRLTAGSRAALQEIFMGLLTAVFVLAVSIPMIVFATKPKTADAGTWLLAVGQLFAWWMMLYGLLRLYRTVNPKGEREGRPRAAGAAGALDAPHGPETSALPPAPARVSVTEGTTELLTPSPPRREPVAARRERPDTNPFESSRR